MNVFTVCKFGGSSAAGPEQIDNLCHIVNSDTRRRFIVISAPGKRYPEDKKVTDLYLSLRSKPTRAEKDAVLEQIENRFRGILEGWRLEHDLLDRDFQTIRAAAHHKKTSVDFLASRGEYLNAKILAKRLGYRFVDAADFICFDRNGRFNMRKTKRRWKQLRLQDERCVIPGFYGTLPNGAIKTFSRGGSDLTGAIVAALVGALVYENWTDVSGLRMADPRIVPDAKQIREVTFKELRELAYSGATVLHHGVIAPLRSAGIPINLRNTNCPKDGGTWIVPDEQAQPRLPGTIAGIAGRKNFLVITLSKFEMNEEKRFIERACGVFSKYGINLEHIPTSIDDASFVVSCESLNGKRNSVLSALKKALKPDSIKVEPPMALICIVGNTMSHTPGVAGKVFKDALAARGINVRMIIQGASERNITIGVDEADFEEAIRVLYEIFAA